MSEQVHGGSFLVYCIPFVLPVTQDSVHLAIDVALAEGLAVQLREATHSISKEVSLCRGQATPCRAVDYPVRGRFRVCGLQICG